MEQRGPQPEKSGHGTQKFLICLSILGVFLYFIANMGIQKQAQEQQSQKKTYLIVTASEPLIAHDVRNNVRIESIQCSAPARKVLPECNFAEEDAYIIMVSKKLIAPLGISYIGVGTACLLLDRNKITAFPDDVFVNFDNAITHSLGSLVDCLEIPPPVKSLSHTHIQEFTL